MIGRVATSQPLTTTADTDARLPPRKEDLFLWWCQARQTESGVMLASGTSKRVFHALADALSDDGPLAAMLAL
jgi:hypothetical protein